MTSKLTTMTQVRHHNGPTPSLEQSYTLDPAHIVIGQAFRNKLRNELNAMVLEWNHASPRRRKQITQIAHLICDLLGEWRDEP